MCSGAGQVLTMGEASGVSKERRGGDDVKRGGARAARALQVAPQFKYNWNPCWCEPYTLKNNNNIVTEYITHTQKLYLLLLFKYTTIWQTTSVSQHGWS